MQYALFILVATLFVSYQAIAEEYEISGNFGGFLFLSTDSEFTKYWSTMGYLVGGQISIWANPKTAISIEIENLRSTGNQYSNKNDINFENNTIFFILLIKRRLTINNYTEPYISSGFGFSNMSLAGSDGYFSLTDSKMDFAFKLCAGIEMQRFFSLEISYLSGSRNGNTGVAISIRIGGYIKQ